MILIDTNVLSETMKATPEQSVVAWLDAQFAETLYMSSVSYAELLLGVAILPEGRRKAELAAALSGQVAAFFGTRLLPFDAKAAGAFAATMSRARAEGQAVGFADGQIAAIALAHDLTVATRDTAPFEAAGLRAINPWLYLGTDEIGAPRSDAERLRH
jgi:predicted nucleic acid-binding protein